MWTHILSELIIITLSTMFSAYYMPFPVLRISFNSPSYLFVSILVIVECKVRQVTIVEDVYEKVTICFFFKYIYNQETDL